MTAIKKQTPKGQRKRAAILDATLEIAVRDGLAGVSFGQLAKALGISKSGLFTHFATKDELELAAVEHAQHGFEAQVLGTGFMHTPEGLPRLWAFLEAWHAYARGRHAAGGCVFQTLIAEFHNRPGPVRDLLKRQIEGFGEVLRRLVQAAVDAGHLQADLDVVRLAWELQALMAAANHGQQLWRELELLAFSRRSLSDRLEAASTPAGRALGLFTDQV